jgi:RNA polymerase sigma-B factor
LQENYFNSMFEIDILTQELGRAPTYTEISQAVGVSEDQIVEALEAGRNLTAVSLDKPIRADGRTTEPTGQVDSSAVLFENRCFLAALAKSLTDRERRIIELRFVVGMTQTEIGRTLGISQMQVSRLLRKSLARMRDRAAIG